jgi:hypothetical protein
MRGSVPVMSPQLTSEKAPVGVGELQMGRFPTSDASTQWAADYMTFAFSNLLKAGAIHREKTFAVL